MVMACLLSVNIGMECAGAFTADVDAISGFADSFAFGLALFLFFFFFVIFESRWILYSRISFEHE
jgi:hypothetical protein